MSVKYSLVIGWGAGTGRERRRCLDSVDDEDDEDEDDDDDDDHDDDDDDDDDDEKDEASHDVTEY